MKSLFSADIGSDRSRPQQRDYVLMTNFPKKVLTDETQTVEEAGLLGAVVHQKYN